MFDNWDRIVPGNVFPLTQMSRIFLVFSCLQVVRITKDTSQRAGIMQGQRREMQNMKKITMLIILDWSISFEKNRQNTADKQYSKTNWMNITDLRLRCANCHHILEQSFHDTSHLKQKGSRVAWMGEGVTRKAMFRRVASRCSGQCVEDVETRNLCRSSGQGSMIAI